MSHDSPHREKLNPIVAAWSKFTKYLSEDLFGGPKIFKICHPVNMQKGGTLLFVLGLMYKYDNWSPTACAYCALHGSYGLCWLLKELTFPDPKWQVRMTIGGFFSAWTAVLGPYWLMPYWLITSGRQADQKTITISTIVYAVGLALMLGADAQKFFVLKVKRGLITDGFFSRIRHPNYLGEMMIYGSFAALSCHTESWGILAWIWIGLFLPNILGKEASMSRYPEWPAYKRRTGYLLPKLFR